MPGLQDGHKDRNINYFPGAHHSRAPRTKPPGRDRSLRSVVLDAKEMPERKVRGSKAVGSHKATKNTKKSICFRACKNLLPKWCSQGSV